MFLMTAREMVHGRHVRAHVPPGTGFPRRRFPGRCGVQRVEPVPAGLPER